MKSLNSKRHTIHSILNKWNLNKGFRIISKILGGLNKKNQSLLIDPNIRDEVKIDNWGNYILDNVIEYDVKFNYNSAKELSKNKFMIEIETRGKWSNLGWDPILKDHNYLNYCVCRGIAVIEEKHNNKLKIETTIWIEELKLETGYFDNVFDNCWVTGSGTKRKLHQKISEVDKYVACDQLVESIKRCPVSQKIDIILKKRNKTIKLIKSHSTIQQSGGYRKEPVISERLSDFFQETPDTFAMDIVNCLYIVKVTKLIFN